MVRSFVVSMKPRDGWFIKHQNPDELPLPDVPGVADDYQSVTANNPLLYPLPGVVWRFQFVLQLLLAHFREQFAHCRVCR